MILPLEEKIIIKYTAVINYQKLGFEFYKTFLYFKNLNEKDMDSLMTHCLDNPNIIHLIKQISPWDIELEVMCENYEEYNKITADAGLEGNILVKSIVLDWLYSVRRNENFDSEDIKRYLLTDEHLERALKQISLKGPVQAFDFYVSPEWSLENFLAGKF